jgi:hypothetical protein
LYPENKGESNPHFLTLNQKQMEKKIYCGSGKRKTILGFKSQSTRTRFKTTSKNTTETNLSS